MLNYYQLIFFSVLSLFLAGFFSYLWPKIAFKFNLLDKPDKERKIHTKVIPLGGGWAIFLASTLVLFLLRSFLISGDLNYSHWLGFFVGALIIMIGGTLDDRYNLKAWQQIIFPFLAILTILLGGVEISHLTNPSGGIISLENLAWLSFFIIFIWLLGMMYTTKLLDGVDGLVTGLGAIGAIIIFLFTSLTNYYQPDIAIAALIFGVACLGFLYFNFSPASIFLGEGGSLLIGYVLGVLAIISGAKIAIALLIIGLPALDVLWTIIRRLRAGHNPFSFADRKHLHHRLMDIGLNQKQTAIFYYSLALFFGLSGLFLQSQGKILALFLLFILMILIVIYLNYRSSDRKPKLLLHVCCAVCAAYFSLNKFKKDYNLTWYFYNPNLVSQLEYNKRLKVVKEAASQYKIKLIIEPYDPKSWLEKIKGKENDSEGEERCFICYQDRLEKTIILAKNMKFDYFTTSLLVSPYKNKNKIEDIARFLAKKYKTKFLQFNWQANNGFKLSLDLAKKNKWYRQNFCGCLFSQNKVKYK